MTTSDNHFNFLRGFAQLARGTEIPDCFSVWTGISTVSAALGRKTWLDMGTYVLYPNFYIILLGSSGRYRKSTAVGLAEKIVREIPDINIVSQRITPEALIDTLRMKLPDNNQLLREKCEGFVIVDELATLLNKDTYQGLASLLISFYDCKDMFEYKTMSRGKEKITNAYLTLLGASTLDWVRNAIPEDAVGSGLTSRMLFIFADEPMAPVSRTTFDDAKRQLLSVLDKGIKRLSVLSGPFTLTDSAWEVYDSEYHTFYEKSPFYENKLLSGYASRRHAHLLKLAMILAVTDTETLQIDAQHVIGARYILVDRERFMPKVLNLITATSKGADAEWVLNLIGNGKKGLTRSDLTRRTAHRLDRSELAMVLDTLQDSGMILVSTQGSTVLYTLRDHKV